MALTAATMGPQGLQRAIEDLGHVERQARARSTRRTLKIYQGDWAPFVTDRIARVYRQQSTKAEIQKFISTERNLMVRTTNAVSVTYTQPPRRTLDGGGKASNKALIDVLYEAEMDTQAEQWAKLAFVSGVVHVVPSVQQRDRWPAKQLVFDAVLPQDADAIFEPNDPDHPAILVYRVDQGDEQIVALDSEAWNYYDKSWRLLRRVEHNLGRMPAVQFRVRPRPFHDYWDYRLGETLSQATIEVARVSAQYRWVRKNSNSKIASFFSEQLDDGSEDAITAEQGIARSVDPNEAEFTVHNYETLPDAFIKEMKEIAEQVAELVGVPTSRVDFQNEGAGYTPGEHEALSKIRTGQIKHLARAERELVWTASQMMRVFGHPLAPKLNPDRVWKTYTTDFGLLTYVDDPLKMLQVSNELVKQGQSDPVCEYMKTHPNLTREDATVAVLRHIETRGKITEFQAKHGIANDPRAEPKDDRDNKAQQEGREGGRQSRPPPPDGDEGEQED